MWFRIALRNLSRNGRRTILTLSVIALGTAMSFALAGYMDDALSKLRSETVKQYGNFQIAEPQFWDDDVTGQASRLNPAMQERVRDRISNYSDSVDITLNSSPQTELTGLLTDGGGIYSKVVTLTAFEPNNEALNYNNIVLPEWRLREPDPDEDPLPPSGIFEGDFNRILIGESLAKEFNVDRGGVVRFSTQTANGQVILQDFIVAGVFQMNDANDEGSQVYVPLLAVSDSFSGLLRSDDVSKVIVTVSDIDQTDDSIAAVQQVLNEIAVELNVEAQAEYEVAMGQYQQDLADFQAAQADAEGDDQNQQGQPPGAFPPQEPTEPAEIAPLEIKSWEDLSVFYQQVRGFFDALFGFLTFAVILLVFFIVYQVLSMSFLERTREVGTIRAIGTKRQQVFSMFISESLILGIMGGAMGLALGWLLGQGINAAQFGWTPPGAIREVPVELALTLQNAWMPFLISAIATLLSAFMPSIHSARIQIVEALRTN